MEVSNILLGLDKWCLYDFCNGRLYISAAEINLKVVFLKFFFDSFSERY